MDHFVSYPSEKTRASSKPPAQSRLLGMRARRAVGNTAGQVILTLLGLLWIVPLLYLLAQSFRAEPGAWSPGFFPQTWTLDNYRRLFTETQFPRWYGNTLLIAVVSCTITTLFVLAVSYAFSRIRFPARKPLMNIMLILGMFPGFMSMSAVYFLLKILLPSNYQSHASLIIVYSAGAALSYYIAKGFFDTVPKSLDEAARMDGATRAQVFRCIILPSPSPSSSTPSSSASSPPGATTSSCPTSSRVCPTRGCTPSPWGCTAGWSGR